MQYLATVFRHFHNDSLYRNSIYLILSTAVMSFFGFFFWIINARLYKPEDIGISTTLISVSTLIATFSLLGYNNALIRYLPKFENKNVFINSVIAVILLTSFILATIFVFNIQFFAPKLIFLSHSIWIILFLIVSFVIHAVNSISDSIFVAFREARYVLIFNTVQSILKLILAALLFSFGSLGIYMAFTGGSTLALLLTIFFLYLFFKYKFSFNIDFSVLKQTGKFSIGNYIAGSISGLPNLLLPLFITNKLGPEITAYYYMPMMIANFLYIIPQASTRSLFAEGSHSEKDLKIFIIKAFKINALLLIPAILTTFFFGKYILLAFGANYVEEGNIFLQLLAVSAIFISINSVIGIILYIKHRIKEIIIINIIATVAIFSFVYYLISYRLEGIGVAILAGQLVMSIIYIVYFLKTFNIKVK